MQTVEPKVELKRFDRGVVLTLKDATISGYKQVECLKREILQMLENAQSQRIVLDFANVRFFSTPFFALIIRIRQKAGRLENLWHSFQFAYPAQEQESHGSTTGPRFVIDHASVKHGSRYDDASTVEIHPAKWLDEAIGED